MVKTSKLQIDDNGKKAIISKQYPLEKDGKMISKTWAKPEPLCLLNLQQCYFLLRTVLAECRKQYC